MPKASPNRPHKKRGKTASRPGVKKKKLQIDMYQDEIAEFDNLRCDLNLKGREAIMYLLECEKKLRNLEMGIESSAQSASRMASTPAKRRRIATPPLEPPVSDAGQSIEWPSDSCDQQTDQPSTEEGGKHLNFGIVRW